jgi:hypothetical protein
MRRLLLVLIIAAGLLMIYCICLFYCNLASTLFFILVAFMLAKYLTEPEGKVPEA